MDLEIQKYLLSWDKRDGKRLPEPYIISIKNDVQELLYFGTVHTYDPSNLQFNNIIKEWEEFCSRNEGKQILVVTEGGVRKPAESLEQAISKGGEMAAMTFLASQKGIEVRSFEPEQSAVFDWLSQKFSKEEIFYQRMAAGLLQWNKISAKPDPEKYLHHWMQEDKKNSGWVDFDFTFENLKRIHKDMFGVEFDPNDNDLFYKAVDPSKLLTKTSYLSREENIIRDTSVVKGIVNEWKAGKSICVIYGNGHAVTQEPALRHFIV